MQLLLSMLRKHSSSLIPHTIFEKDKMLNSVLNLIEIKHHDTLLALSGLCMCAMHLDQTASKKVIMNGI